MATRVTLAMLLPAVLLASTCGQTPAPSPTLTPLRQTAPVPDDADDPAVWINRRDASRSLIVGTNKAAAPGGGLYVFDLEGRIRYTVTGLDRPNNVDVEYGLATTAGAVDVVVTTERLQHRLRVFHIGEEGLVPLDGGRGVPVLQGEPGDRGEPMGIALYRRPRDGAVFAIVAPKNGGATNYLWQYRLAVEPSSGLVHGSLVRRFGNYSGTAEIEAVTVDDALGYVYYSDEVFGIRKWHADPDHPDAGRELAVFGREGFKQQREGLAIVPMNGHDGFIVVSDQIEGATELRVYRRGGRDGGGHDHEPVVAAIRTSADSTDGLEVAASDLGGEFAGGLLVMMNSRDRNFHLYRWADVLQLLPR
jgi:3-phytase